MNVVSSLKEREKRSSSSLPAGEIPSLYSVNYRSDVVLLKDNQVLFLIEQPTQPDDRRLPSTNVLHCNNSHRPSTTYVSVSSPIHHALCIRSQSLLQGHQTSLHRPHTNNCRSIPLHLHHRRLHNSRPHLRRTRNRSRRIRPPCRHGFERGGVQDRVRE